MPTRLSGADERWSGAAWGEPLGLWFESLVVRDVRTYAELQDADVRHYRDERGLEVVITATGYGYVRPDGVHVVPFAALTE